MSIQANFPAIKPTLLLDFANTEALDPRITYSRASTGTYYDGKTVAKAEENLLTFSEQFNNAAWFVANISVTANTSTAPDGTTTADTVIPATSNTAHFVYQPISLTSGSSYTMTVYAKPAGYNRVMLRENTTAGYFVAFDVSLGTVVNTSGATGTINAVGNGWYRCSMTITAPAAASAAMAIIGLNNTGSTFADATFTGDGTSGILIWGAQLEQRASATAYTPTTTQPVTNYIPVMLTAASGVPRFEHNPVTGESLGLEIEEQRTNLLTYSEQFDNAAWTKTNTTITANATAAPDGNLTADKLVENTSSGLHQTRTAVGFTISGSYSTTIYAKAGERNFIYIATLDPATYRLTYFNLVTGTVATKDASHTASITPVGNGWYRCTVSYSFPAGVAYIYYGAAILDNSDTYTGDGFSGIYIWGAQLEAGAFPTSYIPTVASQVTRAADSAVMTGANFSSWFNQSAGTISAEFDVVSTAGLGMSVFSIAAPSNNGYLLYKGASQAGLYAYTDNNFSNSLGNLSANTLAKAAIAYNGISNAGILNGAAPLSIVPVAVKTPTQMQIGASSGVTLSGRIRKITYYPQRLSNAQLQALTS